MTRPCGARPVSKAATNEPSTTVSTSTALLPLQRDEGVTRVGVEGNRHRHGAVVEVLARRKHFVVRHQVHLRHDGADRVLEVQRLAADGESALGVVLLGRNPGALPVGSDRDRGEMVGYAATAHGGVRSGIGSQCKPPHDGQRVRAYFGQLAVGCGGDPAGDEDALAVRGDCNPAGRWADVDVAGHGLGPRVESQEATDGLERDVGRVRARGEGDAVRT